MDNRDEIRQEDPRQRLEKQAEGCRRAWTGLTAERRSQLRDRLLTDTSPFASVWIEVLERRHPFATWLDSAAPFADLPTEYEEGPSPRQIISSHPFTDVHPWFNLPMFRESSSMPRG